MQEIEFQEGIFVANRKTNEVVGKVSHKSSTAGGKKWSIDTSGVLTHTIFSLADPKDLVRISKEEYEKAVKENNQATYIYRTI